MKQKGQKSELYGLFTNPRIGKQLAHWRNYILVVQYQWLGGSFFSKGII